MDTGEAAADFDILPKQKETNVNHENTQIIATTNIYDEAFKLELKGFCHQYQIPFLENNTPLCCINAAKVYYKM
jgi:hypothetical protein